LAQRLRIWCHRNTNLSRCTARHQTLGARWKEGRDLFLRVRGWYVLTLPRPRPRPRNIKLYPRIPFQHITKSLFFFMQLTHPTAQKLLFEHTDTPQTDLTPLFSGYYDTVNAGLKQDPTSYAAIADKEGIPAQRWLFLSDNVKGNMTKTVSTFLHFQLRRDNLLFLFFFIFLFFYFLFLFEGQGSHRK
jgi:hypothetical protein